MQTEQPKQTPQLLSPGEALVLAMEPLSEQERPQFLARFEQTARRDGDLQGLQAVRAARKILGLT